MRSSSGLEEAISSSSSTLRYLERKNKGWEGGREGGREGGTEGRREGGREGVLEASLGLLVLVLKLLEIAIESALDFTHELAMKISLVCQNIIASRRSWRVDEDVVFVFEVPLQMFEE